MEIAKRKNMKEKLLQNLQSIPPLPESVQEVERVYRDIDSSFDDMQRTIEKDPLLSANILRIANSAFYGLKIKVTNLHKAIALLGKSAIRTFVLSSAIDANFEIDTSPYGVSQEEFRSACELQMALATLWLAKSDQESCEVVAPGAFLGDIGRVIISKTLIDARQDREFLDLLKSGEDATELELRFCGMTSSEVTARLFEQWGLASELIALIRHSVNPAGAPEDFVKMAAKLKAAYESVPINGRITDESIDKAKDTIRAFELDMQSYDLALEKITQSS